METHGAAPGLVLLAKTAVEGTAAQRDHDAQVSRIVAIEVKGEVLGREGQHIQVGDLAARHVVHNRAIRLAPGQSINGGQRFALTFQGFHQVQQRVFALFTHAEVHRRIAHDLFGQHGDVRAAHDHDRVGPLALPHLGRFDGGRPLGAFHGKADHLRVELAQGLHEFSPDRMVVLVDFRAQRVQPQLMTMQQVVVRLVADIFVARRNLSVVDTHFVTGLFEHAGQITTAQGEVDAGNLLQALERWVDQ